MSQAHKLSLRIARQVRDLPPSGIRRFFDLVMGMEDVISLGVGEPDFSTPWRICDAAIEALQRGYTSYTSNLGLLPLRQAIADHLRDEFGVEYDPESEIIVTNGVSEALDLAARALLEPGDEVLVPEPCYVSYKATVSLAGGKPVPVATRAEDEFKLQVEALEEAVTDRTRAIIIGYPNNPTGAVMTAEELAPIAGFAEAHRLAVFSDEIYAHLTYSGRHTCFASLPGMREQTVLLNGFSKAWAMTGWRLGFACAPAEVIAALNRIHAYTALCANTLGQFGAIEALANCQRERAEMLQAYDERRRLLVSGLRELGLECFEPRGAFYAFPSVEATGLSDEEFAERLLMEHQVAVVPGRAFGEAGEGHVRCCYATSMENLRVALERIGDFLDSLPRQV
ncbi:MAG: aminotransferase class I/II-fold pyridoxal phosphate-dependent enzyme [Armatimonadetes bacterium]|nr:aminotransferase class I/II-fold pyridoxal phosphate-dependent enzyme [Armatimonadota bacterium]